MPKFEIPRYATSAVVPGSDLLVGLLIGPATRHLCLRAKMFRVERSGTRWPGIVLACALLFSFISADQAGRRRLEATTVGSGDSANGSAVLFTQGPPPAFRTAANLVIVDVQVVAAQGKPVPGLTTAQFGVSIAGRKRKVVLAEFLHADEGPINRSPRTASAAACVFGFERSAKGANAHYLLGMEPSDTDKSGIKHPKVEVNDKGLTVGRWAWRSRVPAPNAR